MFRWIADFIRGGDDLEVAPEDETPEEKTKREQRLEARRERWEDRRKSVRPSEITGSKKYTH